MIRRWAAAVAMVLSLCGCGAGSIDVEIDASFTPEEQSEIRRAGADWNAFAGAEVVTFAPKSDWLIARAEVPSGHYGLAQKRRQLIRVDTATPSNEVYAVALHEFGHGLGLGHVEHGVMDPDHQTVVFSAEDRRECERAGVCANGRMVLRFRQRLERVPCKP